MLLRRVDAREVSPLVLLRRVDAREVSPLDAYEWSHSELALIEKAIVVTNSVHGNRHMLERLSMRKHHFGHETRRYSMAFLASQK